ncbi:MAG: RNA-binding protein [Spirochaetaceae bacterium]|nr:RNA-binding protein [Spirochaetaceae bacterium]MBQ3024564.1 RNA-binding protein [Spirochaetaceae bacterium]MBQ7904238.1 RNA-binding protein [Spirochaetaceae bacterium]
MKRIYIGNMNFSTTEESIKNLFSKYGDVDSVEIIKDKYTEQSKGFGFVEMSDDDAEKAISSLNGKDFEGRRIRVNFAQEMPPRNDARKFLKK